MNCVELQNSLIENDDGASPEQRAHLHACSECSALVAELNLIASSAIALRAADEPSPRVWNAIESEVAAMVAEMNLIASAAVELRAAEEPSPRVWNSIEIALRQEGLIRTPRANRSLLPTFGSRWQWARWIVPAAAILLIAVGIYLRQNSLSNQIAEDVARHTASTPAADVALAGLNDEDLLQEVSGLTPAIQAQYADNLRRVNEYIADEKGVVAASPNDEDARRSLREACQEKAMLFELAMDRSLP